MEDSLDGAVVTVAVPVGERARAHMAELRRERGCIGRSAEVRDGELCVVGEKEGVGDAVP